MSNVCSESESPYPDAGGRETLPQDGKDLEHRCYNQHENWSNLSQGPNEAEEYELVLNCRRFVDRATLRTCHDLTKRTNERTNERTELAKQRRKREGRKEGREGVSANYPSRVSELRDASGSGAQEAERQARVP